MHQTMWFIFVLSLVPLGSTQSPSSQFPGQSDLVTSLPNVNFTLNYRHYSGYLVPSPDVYVKYWFFESQTGHSHNDPVLLWLNGGPGCSSIGSGSLTEIGPLRLLSNGTLVPNAFSWNTKANLLFIETPLGVGFSYRTATTQYTTNDTQTAQLNFAALQAFYQKFPHLVSNDFYLAGESYGSIYVATLSTLLINQKFPANFRGIAIGNGALDRAMKEGSRYEFGYSHGLIDGEMWSMLTKECCPAKFASYRECDFSNHPVFGQKCREATDLAHAQLYRPSLNVYHIYQHCNRSVSRWHQCIDFDFIERWFALRSVRHELHVKQNTVKWEACNRNIAYKQEVPSIRDQLMQLLARKIKVLIYFGDADVQCNIIGGQWFVDDLKLNVSQPYGPWFYEDQLAGYTKRFHEGLTYTTVLGAGHLVPADKAGPALAIFSEFIQR